MISAKSNLTVKTTRKNENETKSEKSFSEKNDTFVTYLNSIESQKITIHSEIGTAKPEPVEIIKENFKPRILAPDVITIDENQNSEDSICDQFASFSTAYDEAMHFVRNDKTSCFPTMEIKLHGFEKVR